MLAVAFFVVVAALFPFAVGADPTVLRGVAPGVIWVSALLATLLSLDRLFDGAAHPLLVHLVKDRRLSKKELEELARTIEEA